MLQRATRRPKRIAGRGAQLFYCTSRMTAATVMGSSCVPTRFQHSTAPPTLEWNSSVRMLAQTEYLGRCSEQGPAGCPMSSAGSLIFPWTSSHPTCLKSITIIRQTSSWSHDHPVTLTPEDKVRKKLLLQHITDCLAAQWTDTRWNNG